MDMFAHKASVNVVGTLAHPTNARFQNFVFAMSRLRHHFIGVCVYSFDLSVELCDCFASFFSRCCELGCHISYLNSYLIQNCYISFEVTPEVTFIYIIQHIVTYNEVITMGDITSINRATSNNQSLRTTIPKSIVSQFDLKHKDKLEWLIKAEDNNLVIHVKPIKTD